MKQVSTHISVILFLRAGDNSFLPKSPDGFIVAMILNKSFALILTASEELFSERVKVLSYSKTELSLSKTESFTNEISSIRSKPPFFILSTKIPSCHSNTLLRSAMFYRMAFARTNMSFESYLNNFN